MKLHKKNLKIKQMDKTYIGIVTLMFLVVYVPIILMKKAYIYIDIGADTYCSYWPNIAYIKGLLHEGLKTWDMNLGLGASTITYISSILCDPFDWPAFLFPSEKIYMGIYIGLVLKNVCVACYAYKYIGKKQIEGYPRIISSIMIVFSGGFVGWGQHYTFATIYVYFIMMLYYLEIWMQEKKYIGLIVSTALLAVVSPYFCYMVLLFLAFYYLFVLFYNTKEKIVFTEKISHMFRTAGVVLLGIGCSAFVFLPYIGDLLSSPRVSGNIYPSFKLADIKEYVTLFMRMFSNSIMGINGEYLGYGNFYESPFMYVGIISIFGIVFFIIEKKWIKSYWVAVILSITVFVFVNFSSIVFNGFSTKTYRWTFVFVPLIALICGKELEYIDCSKIKIKTLVICALLDVGLIFYGLANRKTMDKTILISYIIAVIILNLEGVAIACIKNKLFQQKFWLVILAIEMCLNAGITVYDRNIVSTDSIKNMSYFDSSNKAVDYIKNMDSSFYRINKNYAHIDLNDSMFQNYHGEKIYSSILPEGIWGMMDLFDLRIKNSNYLYGFDDKQILRNITSGKYKLTKSSTEYFGYDYLKTIDDINIYQNMNAVDFGTIYKNYKLKSEVENLDKWDLQNELIQSCIIRDEEQDENLQKISKTSPNYRVSKQLILNEEQIDPANVIEINKTINPILVSVSGLNLSGVLNVLSDDDAILDTYNFETLEGKTDIYIDNIDISKIKFEISQGNISSLKIYELDGNAISTSMQALNKNHLQNVTFTDTEIHGNIKVSESSLLFIPIPYDKKWHVFVNGKESKIFHADEGFMAVILPVGNSKIQIKYISPFVKNGIILSIITILILICGNLMKKIIRNRKEGEK